MADKKEVRNLTTEQVRERKEEAEFEHWLVMRMMRKRQLVAVVLIGATLFASFSAAYLSGVTSPKAIIAGIVCFMVIVFSWAYIRPLNHLHASADEKFMLYHNELQRRARLMRGIKDPEDLE